MPSQADLLREMIEGEQKVATVKNTGKGIGIADCRLPIAD
jgi:hypothetical protein